MYKTLIVGFGRAGLGLHWHVLRKLRDAPATAHLFSRLPPVVFDIKDVRDQAGQHGVVVARTLDEARSMLNPDETIVHVCTPPGVRIEIIRQLAELGFRRILIEKPLAADAESLRDITELKLAYGLRVVVVGHWLDSSLTRRLRDVVASGELGPLLSISSLQAKPRLSRSLTNTGHPTAFDVEVPHILGVALRLAGNADVVAAACSDMRIGEQTLPRMGSAHVVLRHVEGVRTEIVSDLTSPVRERRIELTFTGGTVVGHYPGSQDDSYAHLVTTVDGHSVREFLHDDSLSTFLARTYEELAAGRESEAEFELNVRVAQLLADAKSLALSDDLAAVASTSEGSMSRAS